MEDSRISDTSKDKEKLSSFTAVFEEQCPFFMSIGMTYEEYWRKDCWLTQYYLKAYNIKKEQENEKMWLQGLYIYEALCDVSPIMQPFSKKGTKPHKYPEKPYSLYEKNKTQKEKEEEIVQEREKAYNFFKSWANRVKNNMEIKERK